MITFLNVLNGAFDFSDHSVCGGYWLVCSLFCHDFLTLKSGENLPFFFFLKTLFPRQSQVQNNHLTCLAGNTCPLLFCPIIGVCIHRKLSLSSLLGGCFLKWNVQSSQASGILIKGNSCVKRPQAPFCLALTWLTLYASPGWHKWLQNQLLFSPWSKDDVRDDVFLLYVDIWVTYAPCVVHQKNPSDILRSGSLHGRYDLSLSEWKQHEWKRWATPELVGNPPQEAPCKAGL